MDPEVVDLSEPEPRPADHVFSPSPRGRIGALLVAALVVIAIVAIFLGGSGEDAADEATPSPTAGPPTPSPTPLPTPTALPRLEAIAPPVNPVGVEASADLVPLDATVITREGGAPRFWRLDLSVGQATTLEIGEGFNVGRIAEIELVSPDRALATTRDNEYLVLEIGDDRVDLASSFDTGDARTVGLRGLSPDRRSVWVATPSGLTRWQLADGTADKRWYDIDDDDPATPAVEGITSVGVVVSAGGRIFLIREGAVEPTAVQGEVLDTVGPWILVRSCDERLRCGQLTAEHSGDGTVIAFDEFLRYTPGCGLAAAAADGRLLVAGERVGDATVAVVGYDDTVELLDMHPLQLGCTDLAMLTDGLVVLSHAGGATATDGATSWTITTPDLAPITSTAFARTRG